MAWNLLELHKRNPRNRLDGSADSFFILWGISASLGRLSASLVGLPGKCRGIAGNCGRIGRKCRGIFWNCRGFFRWSRRMSMASRGMGGRFRPVACVPWLSVCVLLQCPRRAPFLEHVPYAEPCRNGVGGRQSPKGDVFLADIGEAGPHGIDAYVGICTVGGGE